MRTQSGRAAIVLAAGASTRMGSPKALLPWDDTTLLGYAIRELHAAGTERIAIVVGAHAEQVLAALPESATVVPAMNADHASGRSSSVRVGARTLARVDGAVIVQSVDQPCPAAIHRALFERIEAGGVELAIPTFGGRRGHPLALAGSLLPELAEVREETKGLRSVVQRHRATTVEVPVSSDVIHLNLNDPAAYDAAARSARPA